MNKVYAPRLLAVMEKIKPVTKDKKNPHFKSTYADINSMLEDVKPILHAHKFFIIQPIINGFVVTQIIDAESGEVAIESTLELSPNTTAQQKGSEITYFRRYTLQSALGLEAEDDDGNNSSQPTTAPAQELPWLNLTDKSGNFTKTYNDLKARVDKGEAITLEKMKQHYRISKSTQDQLSTINIK
jgi:hypothetical protein